MFRLKLEINKMKMIKNVIKKTILYWWLKAIIRHLNSIKCKDIFHKKLKIVNRGAFRINKYIVGGGCSLYIGRDSVLDHVQIHIVGYNNTIIVGERCYIGRNCSLFLEGNNTAIIIGNECNFTHDTQLCVQEDDSKIEIGKDCMFSHHINVRTSDSHLIYDVQTGKRMNPPQKVTVGDHVWVAPEVKIMKGCSIGQGSIIGSCAIVTKDVPINSLVVGIPAKVVKSNISWKRDKLF